MWVYSITFVFAMEQQIQDQEFGTITMRWRLKAKYYPSKKACPPYRFLS
jgi:hypothetical protein